MLQQSSPEQPERNTCVNTQKLSVNTQHILQILLQPAAAHRLRTATVNSFRWKPEFPLSGGTAQRRQSFTFHSSFKRCELFSAHQKPSGNPPSTQTDIYLCSSVPTAARVLLNPFCSSAKHPVSRRSHSERSLYPVLRRLIPASVRVSEDSGSGLMTLLPQEEQRCV